jgi:hypothetical protein
MYEQTIDKNTQRILKEIVQLGIADGMYLAGGTALALQLGHRVSVDLDIFSESDFSVKKKLEECGSIGEVVVRGMEDGTLHISAGGVLVSFLRYAYPLLFPTVSYLGMSLADERDIACMKLDAMASRGSKKDFIDLYFLLEKYSLSELLELFSKKYASVKFSSAHIAKSLVYFEDAEKEPMPKMFVDISWGGVKDRMIAESKKLILL